MTDTLVEKYRPKSLDDLVGQDGVSLQLRRWVDAWLSGKPAYQCVFEYGPPGTGKTSSVFALSNEFNLDVVEVNASDYRTAKELREELFSSVYFTPDKTDKQNLILIDEVDGILGGRGSKKAFEELEQLIEDSQAPVILICNEEYDIRRATNYFKNNALMIHFSPIKDIRIHERLLEICKAENIKIPDVQKLLEQSHGDLRFAISNMEMVDLPERNIKKDIFKIVAEIFRGEWDGDLNGEELTFIWYVVKANIPNFYNDINGMPLNEYIQIVDGFFDYIWKRMSMDSKESFRYWKYVIMAMRALPLHQKTARITIPKKDYYEPRGGWIPPERRDKELQEFARDMHFSYKKANSKLEPSIFEIWKKAPKVEDKVDLEAQFIIEIPKAIATIESPKTVKNIFDYSSE
jgi:ATPase family associated with various cellular activities (AAA)